MNLRKKGEKLLWNGGSGLTRLVNVALRPVASAYGAAASVRESMYSRGFLHGAQASATVVSIGNITLGGSGKTPLVMELARGLVSQGIKTAILTRGYGGSDKSRARIVTLSDNAESVGDEALLMARTLPDVTVCRGANRADAAALAQQIADPGCYILDDGFGHLKLNRDVDILVIDGHRGFGNAKVFPAGPLREPLRAIGRADVMVIRMDKKSSDENNMLDEINSALQKYAPDAPVIKMQPVVKGLVVKPGGETLPLEAIENKRVFAFSGIGNPDSFDRSIADAGFEAVAHIAYSDHHKYTGSDLAEISAADKSGAGAVLTTEKDLARLSPYTSFGKIPLYALRVRMEVEQFEWLIQLIKSKQKKRPS